MRLKSTFVLMLVSLIGTGSAMAAEGKPRAATPRAADPTLGMALMSAMVDGDGTLLRGSGVTSSVHSDIGKYYVFFSRSLDGCSFTGSVAYGEPNIISVGGYAVFSQLTLNEIHNRLEVATLNHQGAVTDLPFSVMVFCSE